MKYIADHIVLLSDDTPASLRKKVAQKLGISVNSLRVTVIRKEWVKTRDGGHVEVRVEAETNEFIHNTAFFALTEENQELHAANAKERPVVVGFGMKGVIASFLLTKAGLKPIILEKESGSFDERLSDSPIHAGMLFTPDDLPPVVKKYLEEEGIVFDGVDAHQYLPPAFIRSLVHKLRSYVINEGGEVVYGAEYLGLKKWFGKLRGVYFLHEGRREFCKTGEVILANSQMDDSFYLGIAISSSQRNFNENIYGKAIVDRKTPDYFLSIAKKNRAGDPFVFLLGLPKATLLDFGKEDQRVQQCFEFGGKGQNCVSYLGCAVTHEEWDRLSKEAYLMVRNGKVPFSTLGAFRARKDSLKLGSIKPANPFAAQLIAMHRLYGKKCTSMLLTTLSELSRPFPFLQDDDSLAGGMILLHGRKGPFKATLMEKHIHPIAVLPQKSLDFAHVCAASLTAVRALLGDEAKAH